MYINVITIRHKYTIYVYCAALRGATGSTEEEQIGTATAATAHSRFHTKQLEQSEPCFNGEAHSPRVGARAGFPTCYSLQMKNIVKAPAEKPDDSAYLSLSQC